MPKPHLFLYSALGRPDLLATAIVAAPLGITPKLPLVAVARDVACATRIAVLEPRARADDEDAEGAGVVEVLLGDAIRGVECTIPFVLVELVAGMDDDFGTERHRPGLTGCYSSRQRYYRVHFGGAPDLAAELQSGTDMTKALFVISEENSQTHQCGHGHRDLLTPPLCMPSVVS